MTDAIRVDARDDGLVVRAPSYVLWLPAGKPYALLADRDGAPWAELFLAPSLHTRSALDDTTRLHPARVEATADGQRVTIDADSTAWTSKRVTLDCHPRRLRLSVAVTGEGQLTDVHLLGGYYCGDGRHGSGFFQSGADFRSVFNPEPWGSERRALPAGESTVLDVMGGPVPGKEHWFFTPPPFCLAVSRCAPPDPPDELPPGPWLVMGLAAAGGEQHFTALHYEAVEAAFSFRLAYEGQTPVSGSFSAPSLLFEPDAPDPYAGIRGYVAALRDLGYLGPATRAARPAWWSRPIFCGWGSQCILARTSGGLPRDYATQADYDAFLAALDSRDLDPGTVVLDDKWQDAYGTCAADPEKWPDLRGWIDARHREGRRVLLWWKAWDREGIPDDQCVRNAAGTPLASDPSNPAYEAGLRASVRRMLGPDGYDADGLKVDFSARTPSGPGLHRHGRQWGVELLHRLLAILYEEAKRTKPDALVMTHAPNPHFADVTDMIRLNDVNTRAAVVPQMTHRASVVAAACPELLVDTDNWPMADAESFRQYVRAQPRLGVPSLYYATHIDRFPPWAKERTHVAWEHYLELQAEAGRPIHDPVASHEELSAQDYTTVRDAWQAARTGDSHA
ncbi:MAG: hypothetical protein H0V19_06415 [Euzebyales bacterium]|nr:hypothetical protein [Euzebyales bacterium]